MSAVHDPLCPVADGRYVALALRPVGTHPDCRCDLIARVVERESARQQGGVLPDSWHYLHMTGCPDSLANFIGSLPAGEYRAVRDWMDRVLREHERIVRADERIRAELHDYHMPAWTAGYKEGTTDERQQARQRVEALDGWQDSGTIHDCVVVEQADAAAAAGGDA